MGSLTITVGALTSTVTATDAKFKKVLDLLFEVVEQPPNTTGVPPVYTAQERLDMTTADIAKYIVRKARERNYYKLRMAAEDTINTDSANIGL